MNCIPELRTERLILSGFTLADADAVYGYASNPEVAKTVTWEAHKSVEDSRAFIDFVIAKTSFAPGAVFLAWALREPVQGKAIGSISFSQLSKTSGQIDYALGMDYWNRGLMTEAAMKVTNWAWSKFPELLTIQSMCLSNNLGSRRVMEKVGMRFVALGPSEMPIKGYVREMAYYSATR